MTLSTSILHVVPAWVHWVIAWPLYHVACFLWIPLHLRPITTALFGLVWLIALSFFTDTGEKISAPLERNAPEPSLAAPAIYPAPTTLNSAASANYPTVVPGYPGFVVHQDSFPRQDINQVRLSGAALSSIGDHLTENRCEPKPISDNGVIDPLELDRERRRSHMEMMNRLAPPRSVAEGGPAVAHVDVNDIIAYMLKARGDEARAAAALEAFQVSPNGTDGLAESGQAQVHT